MYLIGLLWGWHEQIHFCRGTYLSFSCSTWHKGRGVEKTYGNPEEGIGMELETWGMKGATNFVLKGGLSFASSSRLHVCVKRFFSLEMDCILWDHRGLWMTCLIFFFINLFYFIYFWLRWVFIAACGLSLAVWSRGYPSLRVWDSHCAGFSCGARALGAQASVVVVLGLSSCGSWALEHRLSSCGTWA